MEWVINTKYIIDPGIDKITSIEDKTYTLKNFNIFINVAIILLTSASLPKHISREFFALIKKLFSWSENIFLEQEIFQK